MQKHVKSRYKPILRRNSFREGVEEKFLIDIPVYVHNQEPEKHIVKSNNWIKTDNLKERGFNYVALWHHLKRPPLGML